MWRCAERVIAAVSKEDYLTFKMKVLRSFETSGTSLTTTQSHLRGLESSNDNFFMT
jgi:hypothetical protein